MGGSIAEKLVDISPKLIAECASGMENTEDIARRYGFTEAEWAQIEARPDIIAAIEQAKHEQYMSGKMFQNRAKLMAEDAIREVYKAMLKDSTPVKDKVAALLALAKLGGLDTVAQTANTGNGFSITINLPTQTVKVAQEASPNVFEPGGGEDVEKDGIPLTPKETAELHLEFMK